MKKIDMKEFQVKYPFTKEIIEKNNISEGNLKAIYEDYIACVSSYENLI